MKSVDLNCDLGESFGAYKIGNDAEMLKIISSANIACGFHGGDPSIMHRTIEMAKANHVGIGAHPGFNDLWGFGRRRIEVQNHAELEHMLIYQLGALQGMAQACGTKVTHYKIHGALANMACEDEQIAQAAARAVKAVASELIFVVLPGSQLEKAGEQLGLTIAREIFADRAYDDRAMLLPRGTPGALIDDPNLAANRIVEFVQNGAIESVSGRRIPVDIDTICVHGDTPSAVEMATKIRQGLIDADVKIVPMAHHLR